MTFVHSNRTLLQVLFLLSASLGMHAQTWMTAGPYLQELTNDAVTVVFEHGIPTVSWIEVREKGSTEAQSFYQVIDGQIQIQRQILGENAVTPVQSFAIRAQGLKPNTQYEYRVRGRKITDMNAEGVSLSKTSTDSYSSRWMEFHTQDPYKEDHHIFITSDLHNRPDTLAAFLRQLDYSTIDHFLYNGDMTDYVQTGSKAQDPYTGYINTSVNLFAKNKAFEMVRGNHDTRGNMSRHFKDYFPRSNGKIYSASRWGDLEVIMIDCGEDKVDTHPEYYGMAAFYKYREDMAEWLKQLVQSEEFLTAKYRIVVCHFPVLRDNARNNEFDGQPHLSSLILPLLMQCDIDLFVAGHYHHPCTIDGVNYKGQGNKFEEYIIGAKSAMRIDIENGEIKIKVVDCHGYVFHDRVIKNAKDGQKTVFLTIGE